MLCDRGVEEAASMYRRAARRLLHPSVAGRALPAPAAALVSVPEAADFKVAAALAEEVAAAVEAAAAGVPTLP